MKITTKIVTALTLLASLTACSTSPMGVSLAQNEIAKQRMRFLLEAACINERTTRSQKRVLDGQGFSTSNADNGGFTYNDGNSLVFANLSPKEEAFFNDDGRPNRIEGRACSVGSPAVSVRDANEIVAQVLAPRLVSDTRRLPAVIGVGQSPNDGGNGYFFQDVAIVVGQGKIDMRAETGESLSLPMANITVIRSRR
ncbi:hypothetical protein [Pseudaestuariivita rosea]|uniref:hypothetical protein n=1 Tax=Pseudaestuariivita rosea TaxID=2763263 RepID=UPI001ABBBEAD|nr:hypothetical protein [Pseudaestuariivita rosea]